MLNGVDCSYEGGEHVLSYDCSNRGMDVPVFLT